MPAKATFIDALTAPGAGGARGVGGMKEVEAVRVAIAEPVIDAVKDEDCVWGGVKEGVVDSVAVEVAIAVRDGVAEIVAVVEGVGGGVTVEEGVGGGVAVAEGVGGGVALVLAVGGGVPVRDCVAGGVPVWDAVRDADGEGVLEGVGETTRRHVSVTVHTPWLDGFAQYRTTQQVAEEHVPLSVGVTPQRGRCTVPFEASATKDGNAGLTLLQLASEARKIAILW